MPACLRTVLTAALCAPIPAAIVVVLDGCDDGSDELAGEYGPDVHFISVDVHNAGTALAGGEKADLVERFEAAGHHIHRDTGLSVITSKRIQARDHGFADYLTQLRRTAAGDCA